MSLYASAAPSTLDEALLMSYAVSSLLGEECLYASAAPSTLDEALLYSTSVLEDMPSLFNEPDLCAAFALVPQADKLRCGSGASSSLHEMEQLVWELGWEDEQSWPLEPESYMEMME